MFSEKTKAISLRLWQILILLLLGLCLASLRSTSPTAWSDVSVQEVLSQAGSRGAEVTQIQRKLQQLGYYSGSADGIFGTATLKAVKQFQKDQGLVADGIVGAKTLRALGLTSGAVAESRAEEAELLAQVISAEARGEPYIGQVAVGAVILNRVEHPSFPDTIAGVVYQSGAFTCMTDGQIHEPTADSARRAAQDVLNGYDPTGGALYYYNPAKTSNAWMHSLPIITTIGAHRFCSGKS